MISTELQQYITAQRAAGLSDATIKVALEQSGWDTAAITEALDGSGVVAASVVPVMAKALWLKVVVALGVLGAISVGAYAMIGGSRAPGRQATVQDLIAISKECDQKGYPRDSAEYESCVISGKMAFEGKGSQSGLMGFVLNLIHDINGNKQDVQSGPGSLDDSANPKTKKHPLIGGEMEAYKLAEKLLDKMAANPVMKDSSIAPLYEKVRAGLATSMTGVNSPSISYDLTIAQANAQRTDGQLGIFVSRVQHINTLIEHAYGTGMWAYLQSDVTPTDKATFGQFMPFGGETLNVMGAGNVWTVKTDAMQAVKDHLLSTKQRELTEQFSREQKKFEADPAKSATLNDPVFWQTMNAYVDGTAVLQPKEQTTALTNQLPIPVEAAPRQLVSGEKEVYVFAQAIQAKLQAKRTDSYPFLTDLDRALDGVIQLAMIGKDTQAQLSSSASFDPRKQQEFLFSIMKDPKVQSCVRPFDSQMFIKPGCETSPEVLIAQYSQLAVMVSGMSSSVRLQQKAVQAFNAAPNKTSFDSQFRGNIDLLVAELTHDHLIQIAHGTLLVYGRKDLAKELDVWVKTVFKKLDPKTDATVQLLDKLHSYLSQLQ